MHIKKERAGPRAADLLKETKILTNWGLEEL